MGRSLPTGRRSTWCVAWGGLLRPNGIALPPPHLTINARPSSPRDGARRQQSPDGRAASALPRGFQALYPLAGQVTTPASAPEAPAPATGGSGGGGGRQQRTATSARRPGSCGPRLTATRLLGHRCAAAEPGGVRPVPPPHGGRHRRRLAAAGVSCCGVGSRLQLKRCSAAAAARHIAPLRCCHRAVSFFSCTLLGRRSCWGSAPCRHSFSPPCQPQSCLTCPSCCLLNPLRNTLLKV